ncbi:hypothetical protein OH76DRAFT_1491034 [Lentinus brumalis]|uniref:Uncharacterized protein n=1 Tax=Lentinus brumalis TaxID=2498619 RepID=A0A371CGZ2_9APHY|nr:hypothetical protein OH76DRAFT_1491034 [Polyporus brumalis]
MPPTCAFAETWCARSPACSRPSMLPVLSGRWISTDAGSIHDRTRRRPVEQRLRRSTLVSAVRAVADPRQTVCLAVSMSANHRRLELTESCGGPMTCQCRHLATRLCRGHLRGSRSSRVSTSDDSSLLMPAGGQLATLCIDNSGQPDVPLVNWDGAVALGQYVRIQYPAKTSVTRSPT